MYHISIRNNIQLKNQTLPLQTNKQTNNQIKTKQNKTHQKHINKQTFKQKSNEQTHLNKKSSNKQNSK